MLTLKSTLALLAAVQAASSTVEARKNYGKHMKMVQRRTGTSESAPYGYDRCECTERR